MAGLPRERLQSSSAGWFGLALLVLVLSLVAPSVALSGGANYLNSGELLQRALNALFEKIGDKPKVSLVLVEPALVTVLTQSKEAPYKAEEWSISRLDYLLFDKDQVSGPAAHQSEGVVPGAERSFFDLDEVDIDELDHLRRRAIDHARLEDPADVTSLRIAREAIVFPERAYGPIQWRIGVASQRESATVFADASGTITGADLSGTIRAQNLDMLAQDDWPAAEAQAELAGAVGDGAILVEVLVSKTAVQLATEVPESPNLLRDYFWDYAGVRRGQMDRLNPIVMGLGNGLEPFRLRDIDLSALPQIKAAARDAYGRPQATLSGLSAIKPKGAEIRWRINFAEADGRVGHVETSVGGNMLAVEYPPAAAQDTPSP